MVSEVERKRQYKRECCRRYRAAHREELREKARRYTRWYYAAHREERREAARRYRVTHREEMREWTRQYRAADRHKKPCVGCGRPCTGRALAPRCCKCAGLYYRGDKNPTYRGGTITAAGYRRLNIGGRNGGNLYKHRLIWEAAHGPLPKGWHVHHLNGEKADNRLCNLLAMPNVAHFKLHLLITSGAFSLGQAAVEARQMMAAKAPTVAEARKVLRAQYRGYPGKQASYERNLLRPGWPGRMSPVERTYVCQALYEQTRKLLATVPRRTGTGPGVV